MEHWQVCLINTLEFEPFKLLGYFNVGGLSAAITTPLDVAKTRIMLADSSTVEAKGHIIPVLKLIHREHGVTG